MRIRSRYLLTKSPLYRVGSKARLFAVLGLTQSELGNLASEDNYKVWPRREGDGFRVIEAPIGELKRVHSRVQNLLSRVEVPEWVFSGVRGRSYVGNAKAHAGHTHFVSCDIRKFYQSTRREYVFRLFHYRMEQVPDVAWALTDLLTFRGHLPTGSPSSQLLAFWAYEPLFQELHGLATSSEATFSLYVDDITISSAAPLQPGLIRSIETALGSYDLRLKAHKTRLAGPGSWKLVTGVALAGDGTPDVPNKLRRAIARERRAAGCGKNAPSPVVRLHGLLCSARQIVPRFHEELFRQARELLKRKL